MKYLQWVGKLSGREINPIMVKELRQIVRSRFVVSILMLFLLIMVASTGIVLATTGLVAISNPTGAYSAGRTLFHVLFGILTGGCLLFIPAYTGIRLSMERQVESIDLLFITSIRPSAIIRGKLLAGSCIALMLFSAGMPFMSFTYLLRGVDLVSIFVILITAFLATMLSIQSVIFLACVPGSKLFKGLIGVVATGGTFFAIGGLNAGAAGMLMSGIGSTLWTWSFWGFALIALGIGGALFGAFFVLSTALISPVSANRALPVRIYLTVIWIIWGVVTFVIAMRESEGEIMLVWMIPSILTLIAAMLAVVSEDDVLSLRVRRRIPRSIVRLPLMLFYTGPCGGIAWVALLALATFFVAGIPETFIGKSHHSDMKTTTELFTGVAIYVFAYAMSAATVRRLFLRNKVRSRDTWVLALLFVSALSLLPTITIFAIRGWTNESLGFWQLGNIFTLGDDKIRPYHIQFAAAWAAAITLFNLRWFARQVRDFRPLDQEDG